MDTLSQPSEDRSLAAMAARSTSAVEDLPDSRQYDRSVDQTLDDALLEAIDAAEAAEKTALATVLRYELGSHYLDCQR